MKQMGVIIIGGGINHELKIEEAKARGFEIKVFDTHVELWGDYKKINKQGE